MIHALLAGLLFQATPFTPMEHPGVTPDRVERVLALCPLPTSNNRRALLDHEEHLANRVRDAKPEASAAQWGALACARARLDAIGALSRSSHRMDAGTSWRDGAIDAAIYATRLPAADAGTFELLGLLALMESHPDALPGLATTMRRAAASGITSPSVLRACSEFAVRSADAAALGECGALGLASGQDSTWHLIRLARQRFREADSLGGFELFELAASAAHASEELVDLDWHLQWFLSPAEWAAWTELPDSFRGSWVRDQLIERDLRDGRAPAARLAEHFARLDHVERNFMLDVASARRATSRSNAGMFHSSPAGAPPVVETIYREYQRWQVDFDDRGVVWMRFGKPDLVAGNVPPDGVRGIETWRYDIDGTPMFVHFTEADLDGSSGNTMSVVGVVGPWQCGLDSWRCLLADRIGGIPPEQLLRARDADREYLAIATTRDDNSPRGVKQPIRALGQVHQLWHVTTGDPMLIVAYGMRLQDLRVTTDSAGVERADVALVLRWWHPELAEWNEDSLPGLLPVPATRTGETHLTGFKVYTGVAGVGSWGLVAAQPGGRWGRAYGRLTPLADGPLAVSDLILAPESRGLSLVHGADRIFLSPGGSVVGTAPLRLYYQVRSTERHAQVATTIEVRRVGAAGTDSLPAIQLSFTGALEAGITPIAREVSVAELRSGRYQLDVTVTVRGVGTVRRQVLITLD
jgi:hypothetical protein